LHDRQDRDAEPAAVEHDIERAHAAPRFACRNADRRKGEKRDGHPFQGRKDIASVSRVAGPDCMHARRVLSWAGASVFEPARRTLLQNGGRRRGTDRPNALDALSLRPVKVMRELKSSTGRDRL
jgi:hypothetical protein